MPNTATERVFITGGSGFVGSAVVGQLLSAGHEVTALVREGGQLRTDDDRVRVLRGDLFSPNVVRNAASGCTSVLHLVGIIQEHPKAGSTYDRIHVEATQVVVEAAKAIGARRYIHMSALGAREGAVSRYHQTKFAAERIVRDSGLPWTIFRPSLIHGPGGEFLKMEADWVRGRRMPFLFMPYFGTGPLGLGRQMLVQPVYVSEVARAFVEALTMGQTIGQTYCLGGADVLTWPRMHHAAAEIILGKRRAAVPIPAWYARLLTRVAPSRMLPFNHDQVIMASEDSVCDMASFARDFGWLPAGFSQTLKSYASNI